MLIVIVFMGMHYAWIEVMTYLSNRVETSSDRNLSRELFLLFLSQTFPQSDPCESLLLHVTPIINTLLIRNNTFTLGGLFA